MYLNHHQDSRMKHFNDTTAEAIMTTTMISAITHYATLLQPLVSLCAGLIAIVSGLFAIRYYYLKSKK
ncbi:hypothetical protein UFOVP528_54 [uncultured Caudovirales phage]|uniref:Uncharacterized protein n=1 Tax=uncultured Caudovirales phage TaxID=2100421 RepID=A0A6J5MQV8_9CAUD|nr:hypothetical protein UFOVP528_54 [uncultured Caudovirales phage]